MKLFLNTLLLLLLTAARPAGVMAQERQPSQVPLADPYILIEDDYYYAYGTHAENGIEVWRSKDLASWEYKGLALSRANTSEKRWFWAPEVYCKNGKYYMYFSANEHLFVATASSPTGPFRQRGSYQMKNLLGDEKCIDSHVFFDEDGTAWLFFVRFTDGNCIWSCKLSADLVTPVPGTLQKCIAVSQDWETAMGRVVEGPNVVKHNGTYYLTYSGNDYQSPKYGVGYATASSPQGPWTKCRTNPILQGVEGLAGTGHHSLFLDKEGQLRIVFHAHHDTQNIHPRLMYIGDMLFDGDALKWAGHPVLRPTDSSTQSSIAAPGSGLQATAATVYSLNGQRTERPEQGVYIVDGRKMLYGHRQ